MKKTRNDIIRLSLSDNMLKRFLECWREGDLTYEEALQERVFMLVEQNKRLIKDLMDAKLKVPPPPIVIQCENGECRKWCLETKCGAVFENKGQK